MEDLSIFQRILIEDVREYIVKYPKRNKSRYKSNKRKHIPKDLNSFPSGSLSIDK
jgi:hypothetical protein